MKKTMYELLGMIKDGKAPKKIKFNGIYCYYRECKNEYVDYTNKPIIQWDYVVMNSLNDEVEIIEEPKRIPEKLETHKDENNDIFLDDLCYKYMPIHKDSLTLNERVIIDKLNEILDYLESKGE